MISDGRSRQGPAIIQRQRASKGRLVQALKLVGIAFMLAVICPVFTPSGFSSEGEVKLWKALQSGNHFALLRHTKAPGRGDPPQFALGKCETQRNLSDEGRQQAKEIGKRLRANGIRKARIFSSQWCRCLETAKLLDLGPVQELAALNSFFKTMELRDSRTKMLKEWLAQQEFNEPLVLVGHRVNILALTNYNPEEGELVFVHRSKNGEFPVLGTIKTD
jgi:phosphohistidine phosphatase SixA